MPILSNFPSGSNYVETDPTVPAWAKAASKPSYTAEEVDALPIYGGILEGTLYFQSANPEQRIAMYPSVNGETDNVELWLATGGSRNGISYLVLDTDGEAWLTREADYNWGQILHTNNVTSFVTPDIIGAPTVNEMNTAIANAIGTALEASY